MSEQPLFREWYPRINRADAHAKTFVEMCKAFLGERPYSVIHEMKNDWEGIIKAVPTVALDPNVQLVLGEFFYQLRAALDATMWEAHIHLGGSEVAPYANRLDFPIADKASNFKKAAFHDVPLPEKLKVWLRSIQPCLAGEVCRTADETAVSEALAVIHNCARHDRHRHLHVVGAYALDKTSRISVRPSPARVTYQRTVASDFFKDEFVVAEFGLADHTTETEIYAEGSFGLQISIQEIEPEFGADVAAQLWHLRNVVKLVVQTFTECFS